MEFLVLLHELLNSIFLSKLDSEVNKGLLLLDEFLVLDPVVARVDLANQIEPLLLLLLSYGAIGDLVIKHGELALVSHMLRLALVLVCVKRVRLTLFNSLLCDFGR